MIAQKLIEAAKKQQELTGKQDADVSFVIPGKWPSGGKKRLARNKGPIGQCLAEYENCVLCLFKSNEVILFAEKIIANG